MIDMLNEELEDGKEPNSIDEIVDEVLGKCSGYIKGLGYGPKPTKVAKMKAVEVDDKLKKTRTKLKKTQSKLKKCISKIKSVKARVETQFEFFRNALSSLGFEIPTNNDQMSGIVLI